MEVSIGRKLWPTRGSIHDVEGGGGDLWHRLKGCMKTLGSEEYWNISDEINEEQDKTACAA